MAAGTAAVKAGVAPESTEAADIPGRAIPTGTDPLRLADQPATFTDRRVERHWSLPGIIDARSARPPMAPGAEWLIAASRAHAS